MYNRQRTHVQNICNTEPETLRFIKPMTPLLTLMLKDGVKWLY